jgi:3-phosphoshikimate 1-carboxyvinyltransferase
VAPLTPGQPRDVAVPGDKSLSHRALMLAALAEGRTCVTGILQSADVRSTAECLRRLGVPIPAMSDEMIIESGGVRAMSDSTANLDCGNSGTTVRLLAGIVAGSGRTARFVGDASLSKRPMRRVAEPLERMGARITFETADGLPMTVTGGRLCGIDFTSPTASAQVKSALLLAGVAGRVRVSVREPGRSRDHTERMLSALGAPVRVDDGVVVLDEGCPSLRGFEFAVPGDPSSAAFFAAWSVLRGVAIRTGIISVNPTRAGFFSALARAGASVTTESIGSRCGEPVGSVTVGGSLTAPFIVDGAAVPAMVDELPLIACLATRTPGESRVTGARELRVKESDRIATVVGNLRSVGADADELADGFVVRGTDRALRGRVLTHGDHRIAMAFGVLAALPGNEIEIDDPACVDVSFPGFWDELRRVEVG